MICNMTKYRIVCGMYMNGEHWYHAQKKNFLFWHSVDRSRYGTHYFSSLEAAKAKIEDDIKYRNHKNSVVWQGEE